MTNIVKSVEFMGDTLLGVKNSQGVHIGIAWICRGLGFTKNQSDTQTKKIQGDPVLSKGASKIPLDTNGIVNNVLFLEITYLPLWLAKINANIVSNDCQDKLIEYQLRAKDVLAGAFLPQSAHSNFSIPQLPTTFQEALRQLADSQDIIELQRPKVAAFDSFLASNGNQTVSQVAKALGTGRDRLFAFLRSKGILMSNNEPYQAFVNLGYFEYIETVNRGYCNGRTMVTPKGITYVDQLYRPTETIEDVQRIISSFQ